jgi:hypothetical protein
MSFEMRRRDESARHFMHAERRAVATRLTDVQVTACADAHRRNLEAARTAMAVPRGRLVEADLSGVSGRGVPST